MPVQPLVSFIITYHNEPIHYLVQCLDSVMQLSLSETERQIILVDDGSGNNILPALQTYLSHLVYIRQPASGLSVARNRGIDLANGQYIQLRTPYEHCLDLVRYHNPDIVMFHTTDNETSGTPFCLPQAVNGAEYLRHNNLRASACAYIFRHAVLHDLRFTPGIVHEDEEFTPQLILRCDKVMDTPDRSYFYRKRKGSITHNRNERWIIRRLNDKAAVIRNLSKKAELLPIEEKAGLQRRIDQMVMDYLYDTIILTGSLHELEKRIGAMEKEGLYPLPDKKYTTQYSLFRQLIATRPGRMALLSYSLLKNRIK